MEVHTRTTFMILGLKDTVVVQRMLGAFKCMVMNVATTVV